MSILIPTIRDTFWLVAGVLLTVAVPPVFRAGASVVAWAKAKVAKTPQE